MVYYHRFDKLEDAYGNGLVGYQVVCRLPNGGAVQPIFSDAGGTPIVGNIALTDDAGNFSYFVDASGSYDEEYSSPSGAFLRATRGIPMFVGIPGPPGPPGLDGTPGPGLTLDDFGGSSNLVTTLGSPTATGTDNVAAFAAAIVQTYSVYNTDWSAARKINFGIGGRRFSAALEPRAIVNLTGAGGGQNNLTGTVLWFPANTSGLILNNRVTGNGGDTVSGAIPGPLHTAEGSTIEGLYLLGPYSTGDITKHGIWARAQPLIRDVTVEGFSGCGIAIVANGQGRTADPAKVGLANAWQLHNVVLRANNGAAALLVDGVDANAGCGISVQVVSSPNAGIIETSGLGNTYIAPNIGGSGSSTAGRCNYNGRNYLFASTDPAMGTTVPGSAGSDDIWYDQGAQAAPSTNWPAWASSATAYKTGLAMVIAGESNTSAVLGGYSEGILCHAANSRAIIIGGQWVWSRNSPQMYVGENTIGRHIFSRIGMGGIRQHVPGSADATRLGDYSYAVKGGYFNGEYVHDAHFDLSENAAWTYARIGNGLFRYGRGTPGQGIPGTYYVTNSQTDRTFGRSTPQTDAFVAPKFFLPYPGTSPPDGRAAYMADSIPGAGHGIGERAFNGVPAIGGIDSWITIAGGTQVPSGIVGGVQAAAQADSTATTVAGLVADFNALLAKLRAAKLLAS